MALPSANSPCWQRLASGGLSRLRTDHLGTQMMIKRLERSTDPVSKKATDLHEYFAKWERGLANEIAQISNI